MVNLLCRTIGNPDTELLDKAVKDFSKDKDIKFITAYATNSCHYRHIQYLEIVPEKKPDWYKCTTCGKFVDKNKYNECVNKHNTLTKV